MAANLNLLNSPYGFIVLGIIIAVSVYLLEEYVAEKQTKPGKLGYLVGAFFVVLGIILVLLDVFG